MSEKKLLILYGSQTGNGELLAQYMFKKANELSILIEIRSMDNFSPATFNSYSHVAIIVSTQGIGDPPLAADGLYTSLKFGAFDLSHLKYSVLSLGDKDYVHFCVIGKEFDDLLSKHGAVKILDRVDCDIDYEMLAKEWINNWFMQVAK